MMKICSAVLPVLAGCALAVLLVIIAHTEDISVTGTRSDPGFAAVKDVTETEFAQEDAPIGIQKEYTFTLDDDIPHDSCLAFYTVHQYVTVYLDGEEIYSIQPAGSHRFTKTVGSNWTMLPLYAEDSGKKVKVDITLVYESFRNREVTFLIGSPLAIYRSRLVKDLPQIILGSMAILMGLAFLGVAVYSLLKKGPGKRLAILGIFSVMLGLWRLMDTRFTPFMDAGCPVLFYYIAITMPMLGMLPLIQWTKDSFSEKGQRVLSCYETGVTMLCLLQFLLQWLGIYDLRESMPATHVAMGIGAAILAGLVIGERKKHTGDKKMSLQIPLACLCVAGILADVAAFYIKGNSSGLLFSLTAFIIYIMIMGVHTMFEYSRQQLQIAKLDRELAEKDRELAKTERQIAEQNRELAEKEHRLTDSRIKVMMSQIRSHFIFNVLATISTYCKIDPKMADKALVCFSRYLRRNIHIIEEDGLIDFSSELEQLEDYVTLEQLRFAEEITFEKEIETSSFQIPPLTVQPIVENAIKHGLVEHGKSGTVFLRTKRKENNIVITVTDNGVGFEPGMLEKTESVGIRNVRYRLETMTGGTLTVLSEPGRGTTVTMQIPQDREN